MNMLSLAELLLSPEEKEEMQRSAQMLEEGKFSAFYKANENIVRNILFVENSDEFLDFSNENTLELECFCAAFLCAKGYGVQVGGYEDDLTQTLTAFFQAQKWNSPKIFEIINSEKIYTDCGDCDNFKKSMIAINSVLESQGMRVMAFEDFVYCDCEYTLLVADNGIADRLTSSWQSDSFAIYL